MLIELHTHSSEHSYCSYISAVDLVSLVYQRGASGIVLTDHHFLWSDRELQILRAKCKVPRDFLIMSGQEIFTSDFGDVLVYGANESINYRVTLSAIRRKFPEAAIVWAHPYRSGLIPSEIELFNSALDAIEIINQHQKDHENLRGISDWKTWGFTATSGTDIHGDDIDVFYPTDFVGSIDGLNGLVDCIRGGNCKPTH